MKKIILFIIFSTWATHLLADSSKYDQCILDNLQKANSKEAVSLLKETCNNLYKKNKCANKKPSDLSNEELCTCLGMKFDKSDMKCK